MHYVESMAYAGETPWHGLGVQLPSHDTLDGWRNAAGMNWSIERASVEYTQGPNGDAHSFPEQHVLFRSDTKNPLAVVSSRYRVVQPAEILEFYRDLSEVGGFELETAGVLHSGKKFWALARTGHTAVLRGRDRVDGYLLLATACDGSLATTAQFTSIRVVCSNTLSVAMNDTSQAVKVSHRSLFDPVAVKRSLGVSISSWDRFVESMRAMQDRKINDAEADVLLRRIFSKMDVNGDGTTTGVGRRLSASVGELFRGSGRGSRLTSSDGTVWGLLNGITEYVDHHRRSKTSSHRMEAAWFGGGAQLKRHAFNEALSISLQD